MTADALVVRLRDARSINRLLRSEFIRHSALLFGVSMAGNVLNYLFNFILSRRLGVDGYATLSSLISLFMLASIPTTILSLVVVKYAATYHAAGDEGKLRRLTVVVGRWTAGSSLSVFLIGAFSATAIAHFLRISGIQATIAAVAVTALYLATTGLRSVLQGEQDFVRFGISVTVEALLKVVFGVGLVYAGFGIAGAMYGWVAATACALLYTTLCLLRKHGAQSPNVRLELDVRRLAQTTFGVGAGMACLTMMSFMDVFLVKHYFDAHQAGLYAAVNLAGKIVLFVVGFAPMVVLPKAAARAANGGSRVLLLQAGTLTIAICGSALAVMSYMPQTVISLIAGHAFVAAAPYVLQYGAAMCALAILGLIVNYRIGVHKFAFLLPLGVIFCIEIAAISVFHRTLWDVIHVLLIGNVTAVISCTLDLLGRSVKTARALAVETS